MNLPFKFNFELSTPIVRLVDSLIQHADKNRASDIHIDPRSSDVRVRFRIDGVLHDVCLMSRTIHSEFVARIKIIAGLRIDERIVPQDGRLTIGETLDVRVTTVASYYGESIVMRLLHRTASVQTLAELGFNDYDQVKICQALSHEQGLILVTGPTGSGKTTTLYSLLALVADDSVATVTIEDPVEYAMPNARQIHVQQKRGVNFANGLRSILRQDPDVIMVGEIRDHETAAIATNAALTGHLVFSTLHTNDALSTVTRCVEMGVESYLLGATLRLIVSQRLVRKLCLSCKQESTLCVSERAVIQKYITDGSNQNQKISVSLAKGCVECNGTGYCGRTVVSEVLPINDSLREIITEKQPVSVLRKAAIDFGLVSIGRQAVSKYLQGITSFEEIIKIIHE